MVELNGVHFLFEQDLRGGRAAGSYGMMKSAPWIALLRGVNVGGKNKLPMKELVEVFVEAGCEQVKTYIQSGNVVFTATEKVAASLSAVVEGVIRKRWGFETRVILRSLAEMAKVLKSNPYATDAVAAQRNKSEGGASEEPKKELYYVMFLADEPSQAQVEKLDLMRSPPDTFEVTGREIYLSLPNGAGRTKLTNAYFDSKLDTVSTSRNWRTVCTLAAMAEQLG